MLGESLRKLDLSPSSFWSEIVACKTRLIAGNFARKHSIHQGEFAGALSLALANMMEGFGQIPDCNPLE